MKLKYSEQAKLKHERRDALVEAHTNAAEVLDFNLFLSPNEPARKNFSSLDENGNVRPVNKPANNEHVADDIEEKRA